MSFTDFDPPPQESRGFVSFDTPEQKPEGLLNAATRGLKESFQQLPQLGYGVGAGVAAAAETVLGEGGVATALKKSALEGYKSWEQKIAAHTQENDSITTAWDKAQTGDVGALVDWLAHGIGYVGGQGLQMLATGGIGYVAGKVTAQGAAKAIAGGMIEKEVARIRASEAGLKLAETAGKEAAAELIAKQATAAVAGRIGQTVALGATAVGMEGGEIFGGLVEKTPDRPLTGEELGRAFGATLAAGGLEFLGDKLGLDSMLGKLPTGKLLDKTPGLLGRAARGAVAGAAVAPAEAATEYGQTLLEEYGKGNEDTIDPRYVSGETQKKAIEGAAMGALGGAVMGGAGGALSAPRVKVPENILDAGSVDEAINQFRFSVEGNKTPSIDFESLAKTYKDQTPEEIAANQATFVKALENTVGYAFDDEKGHTFEGAPMVVVPAQSLPIEAPEGELTRDTYEAIAAVNQAQGMKTVVFQDDGTMDEGMVNRLSTPDTYFLSNKTKTDPVVVAGHEVDHLAKSSVKYSIYSDLVAEVAAEDATERAKVRHGEMSPEKLMSEIRADIAGDAWADPTFHGRVLVKMREQLGDAKAQDTAITFMDSIQELINRVKAVLTGTTFTTPDGQRLANQYVTNLERVHDALAAAVADQFITKGYRPPGGNTNTSQVLVSRQLAMQEAKVEAENTPWTERTLAQNKLLKADWLQPPKDASPELKSAMVAATKAPFDRSSEERLNLEAVRMGVQRAPKISGANADSAQDIGPVATIGDLSKMPEARLGAMLDQVGKSYVDGELNWDQYLERANPIIDAKTKAYLRETGAKSLGVLKDAFPGFRQLPVGTQVLATNGTSYPEPTKARVVGTRTVQMHDGLYMLPRVDFGDGRPRTLTPTSIKEVYAPRGVQRAPRAPQTPEFKQWFAGSKVVDEKGEPLVVYHGTDATGISTFKSDRGVAGYFAFDPDLADTYAQSRASDNAATADAEGRPYAGAENVLPAVVSAKNIFDARNPEHRAKVGLRYREGDSFAFSDLERSADRIRKAGFDSYYDFEYVPSLTRDVAPQGIAVFDPNQIKSVFNDKPTESEDISRAPRSDVGHRREGASGRYVGAPDWVGNSPQKLSALRGKLAQLAKEGEAGRYWYEKSARAVMRFVGGDKVQAERFIGLLAIFSQGTNLTVNTTFALQAWYQHAAGVPVRAGRFPESMSKRAQDWLDRGEDYGGIKVNNFYTDLMEEIDPSKVDHTHATMDMWMAIAFDYGAKVLDQGPKYNFALREVAALAEKMGWRPHQVQAAIWTAMRARVIETEAKYKAREVALKIRERKPNGMPGDVIPGREYDHFRNVHKIGMAHPLTQAEVDRHNEDYDTELAARTAQMSWEAEPGRTSGLLPGLRTAPLAQKQEYLEAVIKTLTASDGTDLVAELAGIAPGRSLRGLSAWEGTIGAGVQTMLPIHTEGVKAGKKVAPLPRSALNLFAAIKGYVMSQDAVVWHLPVYEDSAIRHNGLDLVTARPLTADEMTALYAAVNQEFGTWEIAPGFTDAGARLLNFVGGLDNARFQQGMDQIILALPDDFGGGIVKHLGFRSDGEYISNNWQENPNGEEYSRYLRAGRPDLQERATSLRARVEAVNREFSDKYGWGTPDTGGTAGAGVDGGSSSLGVERSPRQKGRLDLVGVHYSSQARPAISGQFFGTGMKGAEAARVMAAADGRVKTRVYAYVNKGQGVTPEKYVGGQAHVLQLPNLYDADADPLNIMGRNDTEFESAVLDAGFNGYLVRGPRQGVAVLLGDSARSVPAESRGTGYLGQDLPAAPEPSYTAETQLAIDVANSKELPSGQMSGADWKRVLEKMAPVLYGRLMENGAAGQIQDAETYYRDGIARLARSTASTRPDNVSKKVPEIDMAVQRSPKQLLAPNGQPSKLNPGQYAEVRTAAFKKWFGDWEKFATLKSGVWNDDKGEVSKVVDPDTGEPRVVYHGTTNGGFTEFSQDASQKERASFFAADERTAGTYAGTLRDVDLSEVDEDGFAPDQRGLYPVFLNIRNPNEAHFEGANWDGSRNDQFEVLLADGERHYTPDGRGYFSREEAESLAEGIDGAEVNAPDEHYETTDSVVRDAIHNKQDGAIIHEVTDSGSRGDARDPTTIYAALSANQIKSATDNSGAFDAREDSILKSPKIVGDSRRKYSAEQRRMFQNVGRTVQVPTIGNRLAAIRKDFGKKLAQGLVDQFAPLKDLSKQAYTMARLSKGSSGAFEAMLKHGKIQLKDGAYDADMSGGFLQKVGIPLHGELEDFLWWVAAHRADRLSKEDRENLFTRQDIAAGKSLASGTTSFDYTTRTGAKTRSRNLIYADALKNFDEFNRNALDMAEKSGLIDPAARKIWEHEFYVPFYRVSEEDGAFVGAKMANGLVRQRAFKKLKGGDQKLNSDLLANTLANWAHLLDAGAKNRAAKASLEAAVNMGVAVEADARTVKSMARSAGVKNATVWFMDQGTERHFLVDDPMVMAAITSLEYAGMKGPLMDALSTFKHVLTVGVTASPAFKVRNLIRDSMQAVATSPLGYNVLENVKAGYAASDPRTQTYVSALASGGLIRFGTMIEGRTSDRVRQLVRMGVKDSTILDSDQKLRAMYDKFIEPAVVAYNELGNRSEEINRAALFTQLKSQGVNHAEAALLARDMMDFSLQGSWTGVRFLTQVVPFMNARLQGLYKLGRGAKADPKRFAAVLGATALFSVALMAAYSDDDEWKKREDWDRDNFWWFKIGGTAFRIPKPFEIGAMGTLAERGLEYFISDEMTGKRFRKVALDLVGNNLSMNPVPQFFKPIIDVYSNKDSFSGRPIESMSMENLQPDYRFTGRTSMLARAAGTAGQSVTSLVGANFASPVQIDHMLRGYFGWLGAFVVGTADMMVRPLTNEPVRPEGDIWKLATQGVVTSLPAEQSRYVSHMYEQAREVEQTYGTYRALVKTGKLEDAKEFLADNRESISKYHTIQRIKRTESALNERIRMIERSNKTAEEKRELIARITAQKDAVARAVR